MKRYVIVCALIRDDTIGNRVVLIQKNRPDWQKGRLNLPGGKIESGEIEIDAAKRELFEETGLKLQHPIKLIGMMDGFLSVGIIDQEWEVYVVAGVVANPHDMETKTDELVHSYRIEIAINSPHIIDNLRYIIPKCIACLDGFMESRELSI